MPKIVDPHNKKIVELNELKRESWQHSGGWVRGSQGRR